MIVLPPTALPRPFRVLLDPRLAAAARDPLLEAQAPPPERGGPASGACAPCTCEAAA